MERRVEREQKLPAFEIDLGDLEALQQRLIPLFDSQSKINCSIEIPLKQEQLSFESVQELREYALLKGRVKKFSVSLSDFRSNRRISLHASSFLRFQATASATAESEAWCAGAIETIVSFLQTRRVWYHWFIAWPFLLFAIIATSIPFLLNQLFHVNVIRNKPLAFSWLIICVVFVILSVAKDTFLPAANLNITNEEGFLRRRGTELTLIIALISACLTIIGWFVGK